MSKVFYKFKAAKDFDAITFDGASISVFDLKKEIMVAKKLGKGTDFSLHLYDQTTNEGAFALLKTLCRANTDGM